MSAATLPMLIQGGMGVAISDWHLAQTVSRLGQLGVISGTGIDTVLVRRLQDGDPGGHMQRAIAHFPLPQVAEATLKRYFLPEGRPPGTPYKLLPLYRHGGTRAGEELLMLAAFVEVYLAKAGHNGPVGMNLLTKVQHPNLALLYGAMLAGVDAILMGAGIPRDVPAALDALAEHQPATLAFDIEGLPANESAHLSLEPAVHWAASPPPLRRPQFLPIVASNSLATMLARKASGRVDGFIIEGPTAGGHNAPPRGEMQLNAHGEPLYGPRDAVDLVKIRQLELPFWLAGGVGSPDGLRQALDAGAVGIQVGTLFAYCDESGLAEPLKRAVLAEAVAGKVRVRTDPRASPTGYPFKVVEWSGEGAAAKRSRVCDLGYLRTAYRTSDGHIAFRCASEPLETYVAKGGSLAETVGRECLCNALMANVALGQVRADGQDEPPLLTSGDDLQVIDTFLAGHTHYTAADVIAYLLASVR